MLTRDEEVNSLKRQLKAVLQSQSDPGTNINHYEGFLEQQAKELSSTKKQLQEYEFRAEECKRKWNQLIKVLFDLKCEYLSIKGKYRKRRENQRFNFPT